MKKIFLAVFAVIAFGIHTNAQNSQVFPKGELSTTDNHTGKIWLSELSTPDSIFNYSVAQAVYGPTAKLDWHIHPAGQILMITQGTGYYQEKGQQIKIIHKGDIIKCMPGVEHWHAAAPKSTFAYIAITPAQKGKTIWKQRVTDAEYNNAKN